MAASCAKPRRKVPTLNRLDVSKLVVPPPPPDGPIAQLADLPGPHLLSFSCGKDSIGMWLACVAAKIEVVPFYLYTVPPDPETGELLGFVERSLRYYEEVFGTPIIRLPHPNLWRMLNGHFYTAPDMAAVIEAGTARNYSHEDQAELLREQLELPNAYRLVGIRVSDSIARRLAASVTGVFRPEKLVAWPIWDWTAEQLRTAIRSAGVLLPVEYRISARSFELLQCASLRPIREHFPDDYRRILRWFPLLEAEMLRYEMVGL